MSDLIYTPLSDTDILNILGKDTKIIKYSELYEYNSLLELLPHAFTFFILLIEIDKEDRGHWTAMYRDNFGIHFFDPYGLKPDKQNLFCEKRNRKRLGVDEPRLSDMLNKLVDEGYAVTFNGVKYQDISDPAMSTCGRWCCMRIIFMLMNKDKKDTSKAFLNYVKKMTKLYKCKTWDQMVCMVIS